MTAQRSTQASGEVTPTEAGPSDGTPAVVADPALAAPDSTPGTTTEVVAEPTPEVIAEPAPEVIAPPATVEPLAQQVVYVQAPKPFVAKGNRGFGILIAILSTIIFTALNALAQVVVELINSQPVDVSFLTTSGFYAPTIMFAVGFILLVLLVNRAGWAAHVLGSVFVGLVVFFGGTGLLMLLNMNQIASNQVAQTFTRTLFSAELIVAALLAREVSLWMGAAIAARGRRVKTRNVDARVLYDQEIAAKRTEYERASVAQAQARPAEAPVAPVPDAEANEPAAQETVAP